MARTDYKIPLDEAVRQTHGWQHAYPCLPAAFEIDREELYQILSLPNVTSVRAYLGINPISLGEQPAPFSMILVGVNAEGEDLVNEGVYDFTRPCPPICAYGSPLKTKPKQMP